MFCIFITKFSSLDSFFGFISNFPNVEYLDLEAAESANNSLTMTAEQQRTIMLNLKHFHYGTDNDMGEQIAMILNDRLESLSIECIEYDGMFENEAFANLKELYLRGPSDNSWLVGNGFTKISTLKAFKLKIRTEVICEDAQTKEYNY